MEPLAELRNLIHKLESEIHAIKPTPRNALRISDRRRELARCQALLNRPENPPQEKRIGKVRDRWAQLDPDGSGIQLHRPPRDDVGGLTSSTFEFPPPNPQDDPDMFGGLDQENLPVFPDLVHEVFRRACGKD